jgi:hypothetical protein
LLSRNSVVVSAVASTALALTASVTAAPSAGAQTPATSTSTVASSLGASGPLTAATAARKAKKKRVVLTKATFDSLPTGRISASNFQKELGGSNNSSYYYDDSSITSAAGRGKVYRLKLDRGTIRDNPSGNHGVVVFAPLAQQVNNACIAYQIRFDSNFDWSLGGKLPGLQGTAPGVSPSVPTGGGNPGDKGWSGRMMWLTPRSYSWAGPGNMAVSYMYSPRQSSTYGDNLRWNKGFTAGRWHKVKQCYRMNAVGKANGVLRAWIDGTKVLDIGNYVYRQRKDVRISHLNWSVFRGGGTLDWAGSRDSYIDFDRVRITTRR